MAFPQGSLEKSEEKLPYELGCLQFAMFGNPLERRHALNKIAEMRRSFKKGLKKG